MSTFTPALSWDLSTAYDLFVSLFVLHHPDRFGLRPSWAAGVRSRLPIGQREFLEKAQSFLPVPLRWLYLLPAGARDAADAVSALAKIPTAERLATLSHTSEHTPEFTATLRSLSSRQSWTPAELEVIRTFYQRRGIPLRPAALLNLCQAWAHPAEFGDRYLEALQSYYQLFFAEEEQRIRPLLASGAERARELAARQPAHRLLETLSHGVHFSGLDSCREVILAPSVWSTPLVFYAPIDSARLLVLFGCRPADQPLTPSASAPEPLVLRLKALADPSRLAILRRLAESPATPGELARALRLRSPTVIHHLQLLRLAGLIEITLLPTGERRYALRREALQETLPALETYLQVPIPRPPSPEGPP